MNHLFSITKSDGTKELFEEEKLVSSLQRVGASPQAIEKIVEEIEHQMTDGMSTSDIYSRAFALLKNHHQPTAVRYSLRRALFDLGPEGFPFESFVARMFKLWGYDAVTDQTLMGSCVEHEMDVVAWKDDELHFIEAKFHNEFGLRTDVKVALYVKARFDDVENNVFNFGGKPRKLHGKGRWLITNTKFTDQAIKYSECSGTKLIGWNYPATGNLHQIIEQNGLYPITTLTSLNHLEKKSLIDLKALTCLDLIGNPGILNQINIKPEHAEKVLTEAQLIIQSSNSKPDHGERILTDTQLMAEGAKQ